MADFLPDSDFEFDAWVTNFDTVLTANPTAYGETAGTASAFDAIYSAWRDAFTAHLAKQEEAKSFAGAKDVAKRTLITAIRAMVKRIQISSLINDAKRLLLGLTVRDTIPTAADAPTSIPAISIDSSRRLQHTINFATEGTPTTKAKPPGVAACEIWMKVGGPPPGDVSDCTYLATDTRTPYVANFASDEAGQTVHYLARWISTRQEPGPWAETASASVGA